MESGFYIGIGHKDEGSAYGIHFPDVPGCIGAHDDSWEGAIADAARALRSHMTLLTSDGDAIPEARGYDELLGDPEVAEDIAEGGVPLLVPLLLPMGERKRVNLTIDSNTLALIDRSAEMRGLTRSAFMAEAARRLAVQSDRG